MSLLQFNDDIMPFTYADILILRYLIGNVDASKTVEDFELINQMSDLNWTLKSQVSKFLKRFWRDPYREEDSKWIQELVRKHEVAVKTKFMELQKLL